MTTLTDLLAKGRLDEIWEQYCGFFDLRISEYMDIQKELLLEQIQRLGNCELGRKLLGDPLPQNVGEFREKVPLTTYEDYAPYLLNKREDVLPKETFVWTRTTGRTGGDSFKWVPFTRERFMKFGERTISAMIAASCERKGDVRLESGDVVLMTTAPPPYTSAYLSRSIEEQTPFRFIPPLDKGETMEFQERIEKGFEMAMRTGIDHAYALASLLANIGNRFENRSGGSNFSRNMLHPMVIIRLLRGFLIAKLNRRRMRLSDIWKPKCIMCGGTDTDVYEQAVEYHWGRKAYEGYASSESGTIALQAWNYAGMTFYPDTNFWEFIPYNEHIKNQQNPNYTPQTLLMDELTPGVYELVFTNFQGGIFTRYRIFDLIEVIALRDDELDIDLPQVRFYSRASDVIDLASMARLTEKIIWSVIEAAGVQYSDWVARKEISDGEAIMHIYVEEKAPHNRSLEETKEAIREALYQSSQEFADFEKMLGGDRLRLTRLPSGAFDRYLRSQQEAGADLGALKPKRMQPSDEVIRRLMQVEG